MHTLVPVPGQGNCAPAFRMMLVGRNKFLQMIKPCGLQTLVLFSLMAMIKPVWIENGRPPNLPEPPDLHKGALAPQTSPEAPDLHRGADAPQAPQMSLSLYFLVIENINVDQKTKTAGNTNRNQPPNQKPLGQINKHQPITKTH